MHSYQLILHSSRTTRTLVSAFRCGLSKSKQIYSKSKVVEPFQPPTSSSPLSPPAFSHSVCPRLQTHAILTLMPGHRLRVHCGLPSHSAPPRLRRPPPSWKREINWVKISQKWDEGGREGGRTEEEEGGQTQRQADATEKSWQRG